MTVSSSAPTPGPIDWTDPCQRATALTNAYFKLLSGDQEVEIQTRTDTALDMVRFQPANLDALRSEMQDAQNACAAQQAGQMQYSKRFAIRARFRPHRRYGPFDGMGGPFF